MDGKQLAIGKDFNIFNFWSTYSDNAQKLVSQIFAAYLNTARVETFILAGGIILTA